MYSNLKILFLFLVLSLSLQGCGDLMGNKVVKRGLDGTQFSVECALDVGKFSLILEENISSQIRCLGDSLNLFVKVVKSEKPGYLSRVQLEKYLAEFRPDVKPEMIRGLKSVFDIGHLITGEDPDFISKQTIDKVINFALIFNQEAALNFGPIFQNESPVTYALHQNHRDRVSGANKAIIQALRTIFNPDRRGEVHKLNIIRLLESFSTEENREGIESAKKVLFLKKVLFGGESEVITHSELEKVILNFDHMLLIGLDIVRYKYIILKQESILQLLKRDINDLYDMVTQGSLNNRDTEVLFTVQEAIDAAKVFIEKEKFDVDKFKNLIAEVKKIVMKGNTLDVKGIELKNLFVHAKSLLQTGTVFHRIYDKFKAQLDSTRPVEETIDFDEYRHTYPEHQAELDQFERITKKYRFMRGEFLSPYYVVGSKRNADAIVEIAMLEYVIKLVFQTYGSPSPNNDAVGGFSIDKAQMRKVLKKFENELIELDLVIPGRVITTSDNISLLGTLFQYQSDKNKVMDVNEATEFGVSLIGSINISADLYDYFKSQKCTLDKFDRFDPACVRANFWKGFCTYYKGYYPLMFQSMNAPKKCEDFQPSTENKLFLDKSISAARTCNFYTDGNKEEIHYSRGDLMSVVLALMHAETTVLRWDVNNNNIMDPDEVDKAYEIYSPALDGFLEGKSAIIKKLKKQIFQYLIKYEQIPDEKDFGSLWKFVKFLLSFKKEVPATRKTIVSVLNVIGEQNKKMPDADQFNCNLLRDPESIPRERELIGSDNVLISRMSSKEMSQYSDTGSDFNTFSQKASIVKSYTKEDKELLKSELRLLTEDVEAGLVTRIEQIRHPNLKNLFIYVAGNKSLKAGLEEIALAISIAVNE
jgi:hypothetical protein